MDDVHTQETLLNCQCARTPGVYRLDRHFVKGSTPRHEKETNHDAVFRTGLRSDCPYQRMVRVYLGYGSGAACLADSRTAGDHPTQAPNKERPFIPRLKDLSFTHIFQMDFVKRPEKRGAIVECFTVSTVSLRSASSPPKMWVKDRPLGVGSLTHHHTLRHPAPCHHHQFRRVL